MTNRERIFAAFRGEEVDRFPVWLKMANNTWRSQQPEPYRSMPSNDLLRACGCDPMLPCGLGLRGETPHARKKVVETGGLRTTTIETPDGTLVGEQSLDPCTQSWHPTRFMVNSEETLGVARWWFRDTEYAVVPAEAEKNARRYAQLKAADAVTTSGVGPTPLMDMIEHLCGPETTVYLMHDAPELFREVVALMQEDRMRALRALLPNISTDTFWISENTSTTLIGPALFEEFCMPHLAEYANLIIERDIVAVHHMCGTLNALLEMIDRLPAPVNEAYTTRPLGDVSLAEGRRRMPSKALVGGTNATLWLAPEEEIVRTVADDIARCPDRRKIFLTSAGVLPPPVSFEKAKRVVGELKRL